MNNCKCENVTLECCSNYIIKDDEMCRLQNELNNRKHEK